MFKLKLNHASVLGPNDEGSEHSMASSKCLNSNLAMPVVLGSDDVLKLTFYAIYLFLTKVSRQIQDHNQLLILVALKEEIYSTNMGRVNRHSPECKSRD